MPWDGDPEWCVDCCSRNQFFFARAFFLPPSLFACRDVWCWWCGRWGHVQRDCWWRAEDGKGGSGKGGGGKGAGGKSGGKGGGGKKGGKAGGKVGGKQSAEFYGGGNWNTGFRGGRGGAAPNPTTILVVSGGAISTL